MDANSHKYRVELTNAGFPANSHPYKVTGISGGGGLVGGYYYNGRFYEDEQHTQEISPEQDGLYLDRTSSNLYTYNGTEFVAISGGAGSIVTWRTW